MKIQQTARIDYDEVDGHFRLKLPMLFQRLQRAALYHYTNEDSMKFRFFNGSTVYAAGCFTTQGTHSFSSGGC